MNLKKVEKEVEMNSFLEHLKFAFTHNEMTLSFKKNPSDSELVLGWTQFVGMEFGIFGGFVVRFY